MKKILLPVVAALGFTAGCYTHGDVGMTYSSGGGYYAEPGPDLYYYSPGVSIVAYGDDPVFYSDNYYYRYDNGVWYQSNLYNGGWSVSYNVPYGVRSIDRPTSYARFRGGQGWTRVNAGATGNAQGGVQVRDHRGGYNNGGYARPAPQPAVRDHRSYQPAPAPAPAPAPVGRDHRSGYTPGPAPAPAPAPHVRDHRH